MDELPHVSLSGTAHECGVIHGETFANEIRQNVSVYLDRFAHHGVDEQTVREQAAGFFRASTNGIPTTLRNYVALLWEVVFQKWR
ncbi:hypothetical protein ACFQJ8_22835 [Halocatena marina]|uniref:hypothetical protein n=1 Tax=Halocatena marina TaxID=2934937 RepID=UPI003616ACCB